MENWKQIEKLTRLIQETLKDIPQTKIYSNYKLTNIAGSKREIDILIISSINGMEIKIAIECKDYKTSIPVEKIEAFNSKCLRIHGISKKVFVSTSGYQSDAQKAARDFDIQLYSINDLSKENILLWFPIRQLNTVIKVKLPLSIHIHANKKVINKLPKDYNLIVHYRDKKDISIHVVGLVWNRFVREKQNEIRSYLMLNFLKRKQTDPIDKKFDLPFSMQLQGVHTLDIEGNKVFIEKIEGKIAAWFVDEPAKVSSAIAYNDEMGQSHAKAITLDIGNEESADIIFAKDKMEMFHTDTLGNIYQLKPIAKYDPKSDNLEVFDDKNNEG